MSICVFYMTLKKIRGQGREEEGFMGHDQEGTVVEGGRFVVV